MSLRRVSISVSVLGLVGLTLVGCSRYQKEQRAEWRSQAEAACLRSGAVKETAYVKIAKALEGPGSCGADHPIKVTAFAGSDPSALSSKPGFFSPRGLFSAPQGGLVTKLNQEGTLTCPMFSAMDQWLQKVVQPAAMARFGQPVVEIRTMGTYSCRRMNNGGYSARMSEHSFANAIDVGGFRLADGSLVTVLKGWNGGLEEQNFLREVHAGACSHFATVLGPGVAMHHDHLHMDLARHGRRGDRSICKPYPQPVPPPNEGFPVDPVKNGPMASAREPLPGAGQREIVAFAPPRGVLASQPPALAAPAVQPGQGPILPGYRPSQLPLAPRNPVAEREEEAFRQAPPRTRLPLPAQAGQPIVLYGKGQGPFSPLPEHEIDKEDLDEVTGSVGE